jgi:hypothetical protein
MNLKIFNYVGIIGTNVQEQKKILKINILYYFVKSKSTAEVTSECEKEFWK